MTRKYEGFVCIGRKGENYYFADSVFEHSDSFRGVTGSVIRPVSKDEWDYASDRENVAERLEEYYREVNNCTHWDDSFDEDDFMRLGLGGPGDRAR